MKPEKKSASGVEDLSIIKKPLRTFNVCRGSCSSAWPSARCRGEMTALRARETRVRGAPPRRFALRGSRSHLHYPRHRHRSMPACALKPTQSVPNDEALLEGLHLALRRAAEKWIMPIRDWNGRAESIDHRGGSRAGETVKESFNEHFERSHFRRVDS